MRTLFLLGTLMCTLMLVACTNNTRFGYKKLPPNEFEVVTKPPLVFPPDFTLTPPRANARTSEALTASQNARLILNGKIEGKSPNPSPAEISLLARANTDSAHRNIRITLDNEARGVIAVDADTLAHFSTPPKNSAQELDADAASHALGNVPRSVPAKTKPVN